MDKTGQMNTHPRLGQFSIVRLDRVGGRFEKMKRDVSCRPPERWSFCRFLGHE